MVAGGTVILSPLLTAVVLALAFSNGKVSPSILLVLALGTALAVGVILLRLGRRPAWARIGQLVAMYAVLGVLGALLIRALFEHPHAAWLDVFAAVAAGWLVGRIPAVLRYGPLPV